MSSVTDEAKLGDSVSTKSLLILTPELNLPAPNTDIDVAPVTGFYHGDTPKTH